MPDSCDSCDFCCPDDDCLGGSLLPLDRSILEEVRYLLVLGLKVSPYSSSARFPISCSLAFFLLANFCMRSKTSNRSGSFAAGSGRGLGRRFGDSRAP